MNVALKKWCCADEKIRVGSAEEYFKMEVGLKFSKQRISLLERAGERHALSFLGSFSAPRQLFLSCLQNVASARTHKLVLALHDARKKKILTNRFKLNNGAVCWTNWREFVSVAGDSARKFVFDDFIRKVPLISPLIEQNFVSRSKIFKEYGVNPLGVYLEEHKLSLSQLEGVLEQLGSSVKSKFLSEWSFFSNKCLGREPEYYDDFYFMRNKVFDDLVPEFARVDGLKEVLRTSRVLGFLNKNISVDSISRPNKYPSPFCSFIKIPSDIRVSYKLENPLNTATAIYHEFGHALHASSINKNLPYWSRTILSDGLCEVFSMFFESLLCDENYLVKNLKFSPDFAKELIRRIKFTELFSVAFYVANSFFKINFWDKGLSMTEADVEYAKQIKSWMNIDLPGAYWQLHHILPEHLMYVPSYMLAGIRAHELKSQLRDEFGVEWWNNPSAGVELKRLMSSGADSSVGDFSEISAKPFLKDLLH